MFLQPVEPDSHINTGVVNSLQYYIYRHSVCNLEIMWKIISVFTLLTVAHAAKIEDIYGDWWEVAFYPVSTYAPLCLSIKFAGNTEDVKCTYADGRNGTLVIATMLNDKGEVMDVNFMPMTVVNSVAEVMSALSTTVKCDGRDMREHGVVRVVNENYFILYTPLRSSMAHTRTEIEQNSAILFGKQPVSSAKLSEVMQSIDELKNRRGAQMCVTENYGGFKSTK